MHRSKYQKHACHRFMENKWYERRTLKEEKFNRYIMFQLYYRISQLVSYFLFNSFILSSTVFLIWSACFCAIGACFNFVNFKITNYKNRRCAKCLPSYSFCFSNSSTLKKKRCRTKLFCFKNRNPKKDFVRI